MDCHSSTSPFEPTLHKKGKNRLERGENTIRESEGDGLGKQATELSVKFCNGKGSTGAKVRWSFNIFRLLQVDNKKKGEMNSIGWSQHINENHQNFKSAWMETCCSIPIKLATSPRYHETCNASQQHVTLVLLAKTFFSYLKLEQENRCLTENLTEWVV